MMTFAAAVGLLSVALIGFGLARQHADGEPGEYVGVHLPHSHHPAAVLPRPAAAGVVQAVFAVLPSTQAMQLLLNSMTSQQPLFPNAWPSYLILAAWGVAAYTLSLWRLSRREG
jgi:hypothetical protein